MALTTVRPEGVGFNTGRRNLIINGAMQVAQRGTSSTTLTTYATVDRFLSALSGTTDQLAGTQAQSTTAPDGFSNSYKIDCTTAETSVDSGEFWRVRHYIEAQNLQHLKYGTSAAQSVTLSFYVRSNVTGTYACNIYQPDGVRQITKTYAISAADTWEYKTITFPGDTSGTINNDNGSGLEISWFLMAASNLTGTDSTSWGAYADGGLANGHAVNMASSTSNEWYITGVQLEVGENASDFEHRSFGEELAACQRYYEHSYPYGTAAGAANGGVGAMHLHAGASRPSGYGLVTTRYTVQKRAAATVTVYSYGGTSGQMSNGDSGANIGAVDVIQNGATSFLVRNNSGGTFSDQPIIFHYRGDAEL